MYLSEYGADYEPVLFMDLTLPNRSVTFAPGETSKTIPLTIMDDTLSESSETIEITLSNPTNASLGANTTCTYTIIDNDNQPPTVDAGTDQSILVSDTASLNGIASDDGLPNPPGTVTTTWSMVSGPGTVTFADASALSTTATFSTDGTYVLQLLADDGAATASDTVTITVDPLPTVQFAQATGSGSEGTTSVSLTVSLSSASTEPITVDYAITGGTASAGSDYSLTDAATYAIAFKRDATVLTGGNLSTEFTGLGDNDVVQTTVEDALLRPDGNSAYMNYGTLTSSSLSTTHMLVDFDLSILSNVAVTNAEMRIRTQTGNTTMQWAAIKSHAWSEGNKNGNYPGLSPAAEGVCWKHPNGLYTTASGTAGWGTNSDAAFSTTSDGADIYALTNFTSYPSGAAWCVADVTSAVRDWVDGTKPNYGLYVAAGNHAPCFSEYDADYQPVLFVGYTLQSGQLTFAAGETSKTVNLTIVDDAAQENDETIEITLSNPTGTNLGSTVSHTYTITDND